MRKLLLLSAAALLGLVAHSQQVLKTRMDSRIEKMRIADKPVVLTNQHSSANASRHRSGSSRSITANGVKLNHQRIGSAGNALTVLNFNCNQISVNQDLNTVTFIHRNDPTGAPTTNIGQYRFDISKNGGNTWTSNVGPITVDSRIDEVNVHGRFPQGGIYNPDGNTIPDSAYMVFNGTWHNVPNSNPNAGAWAGQLRGRGKLTGNPSTFNVHIDQINNGVTGIGAGFCQSVPGTFWVLNEITTGSFDPTADAIISGIMIEKGVWNVDSNDVIWTDIPLMQEFDSVLASNGTNNIHSSIATSFDIAFDPTGQYGWISVLGDISSNPTDSVYHPIFWRSTDGGDTWNGPIQVDLTTLPGIMTHLRTTTYNGLLTTDVPTTAFEGRLAVDYKGDPHLFTSVGSGTAYAILQDAGYLAVDINYNSAALACDSVFNGWGATLIDTLTTFQGTYSSDVSPDPAITEYNRPEIVRSKDGKKMFYFWLNSDYNVLLADDNSNPNLYARAFDLLTGSSTVVANLTAGDSLFGGETTTDAAGIYSPGANFPVVSQIAQQNGTTYNVPLVLMQIDYGNTGGGLGKSVNPAAFWYTNNLNFTAYDFANNPAVSVDLNGANPMSVNQNTQFVDPGATINIIDTSCHHLPALHLVVDNSGLNVDSIGTYTVYYVAEDDTGGVWAVTSRIVNVGGVPVADFSWRNVGGNSFKFTDASSNNPTQWAWTFQFGSTGAISTSSTQNPTKVLDSIGDWNVCLIASNSFGPSGKLCKLLHFTDVVNVPLDEQINLFPNPTTGKATLKISEGVESDVTVTIYNTLGELVANVGKVKVGTTNVDLDLTALSGGVYLVKVQSNQNTVVKQLTVSHH